MQALSLMYHSLPYLQYSFVISLGFLLKPIRSVTCFPGSSPFPRVLGGLNGETVFHTIELASSGNLAVGGYSWANDLTGVTDKRPLVALLTQTGAYVWTKRIFASFATEVFDLVFKTGEAEIIAVMGTSINTMRVVRMSATTGNYIREYVAVGNQPFIIRHNTARERNDFLYFAMQSTALFAQVFCLYLRNDNTLTNA